MTLRLTFRRARGVGGDLDYAAYKFKVINGLLFAVGQFNTAGGQPASKIAIWDGTTWSNFINDIFDYDIDNITVFNGDLYVGGNFQHINNTNIKYVARYRNFTQYINNRMLDKINVFPNPAGNVLNIDCGNLKIVEMRIKNIFGNEILFKNTVLSNSHFDISALSSGIYIMEIKAKEGRVVKNFIKE